MSLSEYSYLDDLDAISLVFGKSHKDTKPGDSFEKGKLRKRKYHIWLRFSLVRRIKSILNNKKIKSKKPRTSEKKWKIGSSNKNDDWT